ncbi:MAG TPA: DUF927 domain-containing protein [Gammaproteobacteria bacterium]|nr:DUF927 domain-containing protein [Gammaproteobacteria bacterium]
MTEDSSTNIAVLHRPEQTASGWEGIDLPEGYRISAEGVFEEKGGEWKKICGPIWVTAKTRTHTGEGWGVVLQWRDHDGTPHERAVPVARLHEATPTLAQGLATEGLEIIPGHERRLIAYLGHFRTDKRLQSVTRLGWLDSEADRLVFILPSRDRTRVIGQAEEHQVIFQPEKNLPSLESMHESGTLVKWQFEVAGKCRGNPVLLLALSAPFAAPLLRFLETEGGVFHLWGPSSTGKTTALQVGASVWGCGADPGASSATHIRRWNTTPNALEATAAAFNDTLLALDEMGSCAAPDFGKVVYDLVSGQGKTRLNKDAELRDQRFARVLAVSTGEISLAKRIEQDKGQRPTAGHRTRFVDVPTDGNIIAAANGASPRRVAADLKQNCGRYFGTAGPEFVRRMIDRYGGAKELRQAVRDGVESWTAQLKGIRELAPHQERALQRFALVLVAGLMACDLEILPLPSAELKDGLEQVVRMWLDQDQSDGERGMNALVEFMVRNERRFGAVDDPTIRPPDMIGYRDREQGRFLFTEHGLSEACGGYSADQVLAHIKSAGYLFTNDSARLKSRHTIRELYDQTVRIRLYAIDERIRERDT